MRHNSTNTIIILIFKQLEISNIYNRSKDLEISILKILINNICFLSNQNKDYRFIFI